MANNKDKTEFDMLYEKVFDSNGKVKVCGREACLALIVKCEEICGEPCGDKTRAFMYLRKIKRVYRNYKEGLYDQ